MPNFAQETIVHICEFARCRHVRNNLRTFYRLSLVSKAWHSASTSFYYENVALYGLRNIELFLKMIQTHPQILKYIKRCFLMNDLDRLYNLKDGSPIRNGYCNGLHRVLSCLLLTPCREINIDVDTVNCRVVPWIDRDVDKNKTTLRFNTSKPHHLSQLLDETTWYGWNHRMVAVVDKAYLECRNWNSMENMSDLQSGYSPILSTKNVLFYYTSEYDKLICRANGTIDDGSSVDGFQIVKIVSKFNQVTLPQCRRPRDDRIIYLQLDRPYDFYSEERRIQYDGGGTLIIRIIDEVMFDYVWKKISKRFQLGHYGNFKKLTLVGEGGKRVSIVKIIKIIH
jgi:hypothetical protein